MSASTPFLPLDARLVWRWPYIERIVRVRPGRGAHKIVSWLTCRRTGKPPFSCIAYSVQRKGTGANGAYLRLAWVPIDDEPTDGVEM